MEAHMTDDRNPAVPDGDTAADGGRPPVHRYFDQVVAHLEDGDLNADLSVALHEIVETLSTYVLNNGGKPKAKLTLTLDIKLEGGTFEIKPSITKVVPVVPRGTAYLWSTAENLLTPVNPKQMQMFSGPRPVHPASQAPSERGDA